MKAVFAIGCMGLVAVVCRGGSPETAILAAMRVSELPNYSWITTVTEEAGDFDIEGKTEKDGCTWLRQPMVAAVARRLGRDADAQIEAVFRDAGTCVIRTDDGWKLLNDLPTCHIDWIDEPNLPRGSSLLVGSLPGMAASPMTVPPRSPRRATREVSAFSGTHFGVSRPHEELAIIVCSHADLAVDGNIATGTLTEAGAQLLLVRDGQENIKPLRAAGAFRLWMKDGLVVRYELELEGMLKIDRKKVLVRQSSKTVLRDIGVTRLAIPEEALLKLQW